jgi:hypothetical protein
MQHKSLNGDNLAHAILLVLQLEQSISCAPIGCFQTLDFYIPKSVQREGLNGDNLSHAILLVLQLQ